MSLLSNVSGVELKALDRPSVEQQLGDPKFAADLTQWNAEDCSETQNRARYLLVPVAPWQCLAPRCAVAARFKMNRLLKLRNRDRSHETLVALGTRHDVGAATPAATTRTRPFARAFRRPPTNRGLHTGTGGSDRAAIQLLDLLRPLLELMPRVCACPLRSEAESAIRTGQPDHYARFIGRYRGAVRICEARYASAKHLQLLKNRFTGEWVEARANDCRSDRVAIRKSYRRLRTPYHAPCLSSRSPSYGHATRSCPELSDDSTPI